MKATFSYDGTAGDRVFRQVLKVETGTYEHPNGTGKQAIVHQLYEGSVDEIPVRGYDTFEVVAFEDA